MTAALARLVEVQGRAIFLIVLSLAVAGAVLLFRLPVAIFPQTDFPRIVVLVDNGITPVEVQMQTVTRPLEEAIRIVPGITLLRSVTARGSTEISVFFGWDVDIRDAQHLVQGRIAQITPSLPPGCRFYVNRLTFSVFPMLGLSLTSPTRTPAELWDLAYYRVVPRLYRVAGVAETRIVGGRRPEFHVLVDPKRLNARNLPLSRVTEAIRAANVIESAGMIQENYHLYLTAVNGMFTSPEEIADLVVDVAGGTPVRVKDLALVNRGQEPVYNIVTADGRPAVLVNVLQQPAGNTLTIADAVNRELEQLRSALPPDVRIASFYDHSALVRDSIGGVEESILIGLGLSVLVLVGFLKNWRTTLIAAVVIPIAVLVSVVCLKLLGMSLNLMTLGGMAACIGIVIDDAIVMVENIMVHLGMGQSAAEAARSAVLELTPALTASTLTPIVVFLPLVFLGGITAVFLRALAATMATALAASLVLAVLFTPLLASRLLRSAGGGKAMPLDEAEQAGEGRLLRRLTAWYERALAWSLAHTGAVLAAAGLVLAGSAVLYGRLGSGFLPDMDEGAFVLDYRMPPGTSLEETDRVLKHVEELLRATPEVESYSRRTGARLALAIAEPNMGDFLVRLKRSRSRGLEEITSELRARILASEPALQVEFPHILEDLVGDLAWSPQPVEIKLYGDDAAAYRQAAERVAEWLPSVRGVVDVINQTIPIGPSLNFRVDPEKAVRAGFRVPDVAALESAILDGSLATQMIRGDRLIGIRVRYPPEYRRTAADLQSLLITSPAGQTVPLASIARIETESATYEIRRENLRTLAAVTARLEGRDLGSTMAEIQRRLPAEVRLPAGIEVDYGGLFQLQKESFVGLTVVLLASILLIFIILVAEFRSYSHPLAILAATLLCTFGSLLALFLAGQTLNISSFMGVIMVVGIVHKNGILMLDSEAEFSRKGFGLRDAIFHAGRRRLRPILMTALATIFGMLPLAFGAGSGAKMLQPLAIAVIGGVAVSMVLSLLVTPVLYGVLRRRGA